MKHLIIFLSLLFISCSPKPISLLIIGDSISSDCAGGYPGYIRELRSDWKVDVLAYPGKGSGEIYNSVKGEVLFKNYKYVLVMMGINDSRFLPSLTSIYYQKIFALSLSNTRRFVIQYPPSPYLKFNREKLYSLYLVYDGLLELDGIEFMPIHTGFTNFWPDGLHIKPAGNLEIAKQIVERIEK